MEKLNIKNLKSHRCEVTLGNKMVIMPEISAKILAYLNRHPNKARTRDDITQSVWGHIYISKRSVDIAVMKIRKAFGSHIIETAKGGIGYKFAEL